jgi:hypothetical protein
MITKKMTKTTPSSGLTTINPLSFVEHRVRDVHAVGGCSIQVNRSWTSAT